LFRPCRPREVPRAVPPFRFTNSLEVHPIQVYDANAPLTPSRSVVIPHVFFPIFDSADSVMVLFVLQNETGLPLRVSSPLGHGWTTWSRLCSVKCFFSLSVFRRSGFSDTGPSRVPLSLLLPLSDHDYTWRIPSVLALILVMALLVFAGNNLPGPARLALRHAPPPPTSLSLCFPAIGPILGSIGLRPRPLFCHVDSCALLREPISTHDLVKQSVFTQRFLRLNYYSFFPCLLDFH